MLMQNNAFLCVLCLSLILTTDLVHASNKRGIGVCMNFYECEDLDQFTKIGWWYDWGTNSGYHKWRYGCTNPLKENHVPMISNSDKTTFEFDERSDYMIGYNEPNHPNQANMSPQQAADHWNTLEQVGTSNGAKYFVSPSATPNYDYLDWFDQFFELCTDCKIDFLSTHFYSWNCRATELKNFLTMLWNRYNKKIWLTEFACPRTTDANVQLDFMKEMLPWLEETEFIDRYAWYCSRITLTNRYIKPSASLLEENGATLTPLGEYYNNFTP